MRRHIRAFILAVMLSLGVGVRAEGSAKLLLAHYMPWYSTRPVSGQWGWHWTMNHFVPDVVRWDGTRAAASHDYPLVGLYDSSDDYALECQVLLMKFAGLDGVIIDWYGVGTKDDHHDIHSNVRRLMPWLKKAGLRFAICYEDQAVAALGRGGDLAQAKDDLRWLDQNWLGEKNQAKVDGRPILLVFGPRHISGGAWAELRSEMKQRPMVYGLSHLFAEAGFEGAFAWPPVDGGKTVPKAQWQAKLEGDYHPKAPFIAAAFPGFRDIYAQAGVRASYGRIDADKGATFQASLDQALHSGSRVVQVVTWNDYGEGTVIEPTRNHGYRYLKMIQARAEGKRPFSAADLRLPVWLYQLRQRGGMDLALGKELDRASDLLFAGECEDAAALLTTINEELGRRPARFLECDSLAPADEDYRLITEVLYREGEAGSAAVDQRCRLDLYVPAKKKNFPTVVWFHGGGLTSGERFIPVPLRNQGIGVAAVNYRLSPEVKAPVYIEDAAAAVAWVFRNITEHGGAADRVFLSGHSAGAYLASIVALDKRWLAAHQIDADQIAGVIPLSGQMITHFAIRDERGIPREHPVMDEFAPAHHVRRNAPPMLIVTGDRELELMGRYEENAFFWRLLKLTGHQNASLRELDGFDHAGMPEPAFPLLLEFISKTSL